MNQEQKKGRIEQSFAGIGASVIFGAASGGAYGFYDGLRQTAAAGMTGTLKRTQIMNYTVKSGIRCLLVLHVNLNKKSDKKIRTSFTFSLPDHENGKEEYNGLVLSREAQEPPREGTNL